MPQGDRTGPRGTGPMSGWGAGYCSGSGGPRHGRFGGQGRSGRGSGTGYRPWSHSPGGGWRWRHWWTDTGRPERQEAKQELPEE